MGTFELEVVVDDDDEDILVDDTIEEWVETEVLVTDDDTEIGEVLSILLFILSLISVFNDVGWIVIFGFVVVVVVLLDTKVVNEC